jgi:hypothetical protein
MLIDHNDVRKSVRCFLPVSEVEKGDVRVKMQRSSRSMSNMVVKLVNTSVLRWSDPEISIKRVDQKLISYLAHKIILAEQSSSLQVYQTHCKVWNWWLGDRVFFVFDPLPTKFLSRR